MQPDFQVSGTLKETLVPGFASHLKWMSSPCICSHGSRSNVPSGVTRLSLRDVHVSENLPLNLTISDQTVEASHHTAGLYERKCIGDAYEGHKVALPDGERAFIVNLQSLYVVQYARWRMRCGIHTVKVRPITPDIKRALATRKMFFMILISEKRFPGFNDEPSYFYRGVEEQDVITWNLVITKGPFNIGHLALCQSPNVEQVKTNDTNFGSEAVEAGGGWFWKAPLPANGNRAIDAEQHVQCVDNMTVVEWRCWGKLELQASQWLWSEGGRLSCEKTKKSRDTKTWYNLLSGEFYHN